MTLASLLAAALVVCSLPALAQDQQSQSSSPSTLRISKRSTKGPILGGSLPLPLKLNSSATPSEPWRIIPTQSAGFDSGQNPLDPALLDQVAKAQMALDLAQSARTLDADSTCYAIRSYRVARDSKDSDSTHPAGYSTCRPSNRYQVKNADLRVVSGDR
jgi:hypothetical protein